MRFLSVFRKFALLFSGLFLLISVFNVLLIFSLDELPAPKTSESSPLLELVSGHIRTVSICYMIIATLAFTSALGLKAGKQWAHVAWTLILSIALSVAVLASLVEAKSLIFRALSANQNPNPSWLFSLAMLGTLLGTVAVLSWLLKELIRSRSSNL